jgi:hypothetical protein
MKTFMLAIAAACFLVLVLGIIGANAQTAGSTFNPPNPPGSTNVGCMSSNTCR